MNNKYAKKIIPTTKLYNLVENIVELDDPDPLTANEDLLLTNLREYMKFVQWNTFYNLVVGAAMNKHLLVQPISICDGYDNNESIQFGVSPQMISTDTKGAIAFRIPRELVNDKGDVMSLADLVDDAGIFRLDKNNVSQILYTENGIYVTFYGRDHSEEAGEETYELTPEYTLHILISEKKQHTKYLQHREPYNAPSWYGKMLNGIDLITFFHAVRDQREKSAYVMELVQFSHEDPDRTNETTCRQYELQVSFVQASCNKDEGTGKAWLSLVDEKGEGLPIIDNTCPLSRDVDLLTHRDSPYFVSLQLHENYAELRVHREPNGAIKAIYNVRFPNLENLGELVELTRSAKHEELAKFLNA